MHLKTLGGLFLNDTDFSRPKPLLLLAYLAVEGSKEKRHLYELFWPGASDPANSLRVVSKLLRSVSPVLLQGDERTLHTSVQSDIAALQNALVNQDVAKVLELYRGRFLAEFSLPDWSPELEEWVYSTQEFVAARVKATYIRAAETEAAKGDFVQAATWAEHAYHVALNNTEPEDLGRIFPLLLAGDSPLASTVKSKAKEFGFDLRMTLEEAKAQYFAAQSSEQGQPQGLRNNLPRSKTSFIGRDPELIELGQMLAQPDVQLITLLGPGGMGKTRLALQLASGQLQEDNFPQGVFFIALEALTEPQQIPLAIAQTLEIKIKDDPLQQLKTAIASQRILLILDNFEHLVEGALLVSELIEACPHLTILVTSRERLSLEEEFALPLQGLPFPKTVAFAEAEYVDAIKLFVQRAKRSRIDFQLTPENLELVLEICRLVEGSPLGIELAAAWLRSLSLAEIAREIGQNIGMLESSSRNINPRHQSIQAAFEYSWKLLRPKEQLILARLSVFRGGFGRESAGVVADSNLALLSALVDKSLLRLSGEGRYDFHPLLHQLARQKLAESAEELEIQYKHGHHFADLVGTARKQGFPEQFKTCKDEYENLLAALVWSLEKDEIALGLGLGVVLGVFWRMQGYLEEGRHWLARVLSHPGAHLPSVERVNVLMMASDLARADSDYTAAIAYGNQAVEASKEVGQEDLTARALLALASCARERGDYKTWDEYSQAALSLARRLKNEDVAAWAVVALGLMAGELGQHEKAVDLLEESLALYRKLKQPLHIGYNLNNLGFHFLTSGQLKEAREYLEEALVIAQELTALDLVCIVQSNLGVVLQDMGEFARAQALTRQALEHRWKKKDKFGLCYSFENLASLALWHADPRRCVLLYGLADSLSQEIGRGIPSQWLARREKLLAIARGQMGEAEFGMAWQEGRLMELEQAMKYALEFSVQMHT